MRSNQDSKQSRDLDPFSLQDLKQPIPPRERPKLTWVPVIKILIVIILPLVLIGGAGYGCYHYLTSQSGSVHQAHPHLVSVQQRHHGYHRHVVKRPVVRHHGRQPRSQIQVKSQINRNEKMLGRELSRGQIDPKVSNQVLKSYERHAPQVQLQFYHQVMQTCKKGHNPELLNKQLQKLCKKVNKM